MNTEEFASLTVGDTVAVVTYGNAYTKRRMARCTVAHKTATQVVLDNGERYTQRGQRVGDKGNGYGSHPVLETWDAMMEQRYAAWRAEHREQHRLSLLKGIPWDKIDPERRAKAYAFLRDLGCLAGAKEGKD